MYILHNLLEIHEEQGRKGSHAYKAYVIYWCRERHPEHIYSLITHMYYIYYVSHMFILYICIYVNMYACYYLKRFCNRDIIKKAHFGQDNQELSIRDDI